MARVRPGVELVRAIFVPKSELMTLDLPTFERPRNATSGSAGAGNCPTAVAAPTNFERTLTFPVSVFQVEVASAGAFRLMQKYLTTKVTKVHEEGALRWESVKPQGTLVLDIFFFDRNVFVPQIKNRGNDYAKPQANQKK